jgi:hypothetical protein
MNVFVANRPDAGPNEHPISSALAAASYLDPLDDDDPSDEVVVTTRRAIGRVALVATEAAGRFQREAVPHDAMAWLMAPRRVFDGAAAIDACLTRDACMRGILVHGLGLGLDVERAAIDALIADDGEEAAVGTSTALAAKDDDDYADGFDGHEFEYLYGDHAGRSDRTGRARAGRGTRLRLYTATLAETRDNRMVQAFHASVARSEGEVRARLTGRFGPDLAKAADVRLGIHPSAPLVIALVPSPVAAMIVQMGRDCASSAARTFAVDIQQVIQA